MISRPRSFGWPLQLQEVGYNATTQADKAQAGGAACKERGGVGEGAHRGWCREEGRGGRERLWVSAWCLSDKIDRVSGCCEPFAGGDKSTSQFCIKSTIDVQGVREAKVQSGRGAHYW